MNQLQIINRKIFLTKQALKLIEDDVHRIAKQLRVLRLEWLRVWMKSKIKSVVRYGVGRGGIPCCLAQWLFQVFNLKSP